MDFNHLVEFYERINATSKRLEMTEILADLFKLCNLPENRSDLRKIIYLTQGQLVAEIEDSPKFGIAEKMIIQAIKKFSAKDPEEIKELVNKKGDIGEAVQILLENQEKQKVHYSLDNFQKKKEDKSLSIPKLYEELEKLTLIKGDKSQDLKINVMVRLLRQSTPLAAKYIVSIIISNLRIGIANMTIIDALAIAFTGDKQNRDLIEEKFNIHPDLGEIAEILMQKGLQEVQNIQIQPGIPIRMMLASRIPFTQIQEKLGGGSFIAEYKYDGERAQVHKQGRKITIFSRRLKQITDQYPDIVEAILVNIKADNIILEGELVAMDVFLEKMLPFQVVSTRRRKYNIESMKKEVPVCLFCFDLLYNQKNAQESPESFLNKPLIDRRNMLASLIQTNDIIRIAVHREITSTQDMVTFFNEARSKGAEGIMNKATGPDSIYRAGNRGFQWIKLKGLEGAKMEDSIDVVLIGAFWGKGRHAGTLSTFLGAIYNDETNKFEFFTRIGSGFSDEDLVKLTKDLKAIETEKLSKNIICNDSADLWVKPEIIIEIMGDELTISAKSNVGVDLKTSNGYSLRFPIFQRFRNDKSITDITTTKEIIDMYQAQQ